MITGMTNYATSSDKNWFQGLCFSLSASLISALRPQIPRYSSIKLQIYSDQLSKSLKTLSNLCVCTTPISPVRPEELNISCSNTPWNRKTPSAATQFQLFLLHSLPCWEWSPCTQNLQELNPCSILLPDKWLTRLFPRTVLFPGKPVFSSLVGEQPQNTHRTTAIETGRQPPTRHLGPVRGRVWQIIWGSYYIIKA